MKELKRLWKNFPRGINAYIKNYNDVVNELYKQDMLSKDPVEMHKPGLYEDLKQLTEMHSKLFPSLLSVLFSLVALIISIIALFISISKP